MADQALLDAVKGTLGTACSVLFNAVAPEDRNTICARYSMYFGRHDKSPIVRTARVDNGMHVWLEKRKEE